jgi:hypothetical protein
MHIHPGRQDRKRARALLVAVLTVLTGFVFAAPPASATGEIVRISGGEALENGAGQTFNIRINVFLDLPRPTTTKVYFTTEDDTAVAGSDYIAKTGYVSIAAGRTQTVLTIKGLGDDVPEPNESFFVFLTGASPGATIAENQSFEHPLIVDEDPTNAAAVSIGDATLYEGNSGMQTASVAISLSRPVLTDTAVSYQTVAGTATAPFDYKSKTVTTKIPAGRTSINASTVVYGNTDPESDRQFYIDVVGAGVPIARTRGTVTIIDDEGANPGVSIGDSSVVEGDHGTKSMTFKVTLNAPAASDVIITYCTPAVTADAGIEYKGKCTGTVKILATKTSAKIVATAYGDTEDEVDEFFHVDLWNTGGSGIPIVDGTGVGTIIDDDPVYTSPCLDSTVSGNADLLYSGQLGVFGNAPGYGASTDGTCAGSVSHVFTLLAAPNLATAAAACQNLGAVVLSPSASGAGYPVPADWWLCT